MKITLNKIHDTAAGLTQQFQLTGSSLAQPLSGAGQFKPTMFSRTMQASRTGEHLIPIGTGQVDPVNHARVLLQLSVDQDINVETLVEKYRELLYRMSFEADIIRSNVAAILGNNDRPTKKGNVPKVPASFVINNLSNKLFGGTLDRVDDVIVHLIADALISIYAQIGLISDDAPHVHRMRPGSLFPRYTDLVDVMMLRDVMFMSTQLANADITLIKKSLDGDGRSISPSMLSQHVQNAFVGAYDASKGSYAAKDVVTSVLSTLQKIWSPMTDPARMPKERVLKSPFVAEAQSNIALYLAAQDMTSELNGMVDTVFDDEELTSVIFPLFQETMALVSPYKIRALPDAVDFFGMTSSRDHNSEPGHMFLHEAWKVQDRVDAFVPVRQTLTGAGRFLVDMPTVGAALGNTLAPIQRIVSISDAVSIRVDSFNMQDQTKRANSPTEMHLAFPSLEVREAQMETQSLNDLAPYILEGKPYGEKEAEKIQVSEKQVIALRYDYYCSLTHLAVARGSNVSVGELARYESTSGSSLTTINPLYLMWTQRTSFARQRGLTALLNGEISTTEPVELLAYINDFEAADSLSVNYPYLTDHEGSLHLWNWPRYSSKLALNASFDITLRNKKYTVSINEHEMLALGARRTELRFMNQYDTKALVRIWLKEIMEDYDFVVDQTKNAKDPIVRDAYKGRQIQSALRLVAMLSGIAGNSAGQRAIAYAKQRVADQMYGNTGTLDGYDEIHVGVQNHRMKVWAGIRIMELVQLISAADATKLAKIIASSDALAYALSTVELSQFK